MTQIDVIRLHLKRDERGRGQIRQHRLAFGGRQFQLIYEMQAKFGNLIRRIGMAVVARPGGEVRNVGRQRLIPALGDRHFVIVDTIIEERLRKICNLMVLRQPKPEIEVFRAIEQRAVSANGQHRTPTHGNRRMRHRHTACVELSDCCAVRRGIFAHAPRRTVLAHEANI